MSELQPDTRALLDAARDAHDPSQSDRTRIRGRLGAQLGAGAFAATALTGTSTTARAALRWGAGAAIVGVATILIWAWTTHPKEIAPAPQPVVIAPKVETQPKPEQTATEIGPAPVPVESLAQAKVDKPAAPIATQPVNSLEAELALLRDAKKALDDGNANQSLSILSEHERRFPNGVLVEERAATRVLALCAAGRTSEARTGATDFLAKYPRSPSAPRVRTSCGATQP